MGPWGRNICALDHKAWRQRNLSLVAWGHSTSPGLHCLGVTQINPDLLKPLLHFLLLVAEDNPNCYPQSIFLLCLHLSSSILKNTFEMWLHSRNRCHCLPDHCLNLLFVFGIYLVTILRPHQHGCKAESRVLQAGSVTLNHRRCQDWHNVCNASGRAGSAQRLYWHDSIPVREETRKHLSKFAFLAKNQIWLV